MHNLKLITNWGKVFGSFSQVKRNHKYSLVDDYEITGFIGKGSTSRVYQGFNIMDRTEVIIKLFKNSIPEEKVLREIYVNQIIA